MANRTIEEWLDNYASYLEGWTHNPKGVFSSSKWLNPTGKLCSSSYMSNAIMKKRADVADKIKQIVAAQHPGN